MTREQLFIEARQQNAAAALAARKALGTPKGKQRDHMLMLFFAKLQAACGMGYHPDGFDAAEYTIGRDNEKEAMWTGDDAIMVTAAHNEACEVIGFDPYNAFDHTYVEDWWHNPEEPGTYNEHLADLQKYVDMVAPGWEAIIVGPLNKKEEEAGSGIRYTGPWIFHPKGDGGDTDRELEGEFWPTLCKLIDRSNP